MSRTTRQWQCIACWVALAGAFLNAQPVIAEDVHALLIAVADYSGTEFASLDGPSNDAELMRDTLMRRFDVPAANIRTLTDGEASHSKLEKEFGALARRAKPGDFVYIHYSGHGSYTEDLNGDERSGLDQTWVSFGSRQLSENQTGASEIDNYDVLDDEIERWLSPVVAKTDHVVFVSDSCHSASVTRGVGPKVRAAPKDARKHPLGDRRDLAPTSARAIRIGSARDAQSAAEFQTETGDYYGMFTWYWAQALNDADADSTWGELFQRADVLVQRNRDGHQQPQFEGNSNLLVFGGGVVERERAVPVIDVRRGGARVSIGAGELAGVTVGSSYSAAKKGSVELEPATMEIARVWPFESEGLVTQGEFSIGDLVFESSHAYTFAPIRTFIAADDERDIATAGQLASVVQDLPAYARANTQANSHLVLRILRPARDGAGNYIFDNIESRLPRADSGEAPEIWVLTPMEEPAGTGLRIPVGDSERALRLVRENLVKLARVAEFEKLASAADDGGFIDIDTVLVTECGDGADCVQLGRLGSRQVARMPLDLVSTKLPIGSLLSFTIRNQSRSGVFVYLIGSDSAGEITAHFPRPGRHIAEDAFLPAGGTLDLFGSEEVAIEFKKAGKEIVKLIASKNPVDVALLEQSRYATRSANFSLSPLERLLAGAAHGTRGRSDIPSDSWSADTISLNIIPDASRELRDP